MQLYQSEFKVIYKDLLKRLIEINREKYNDESKLCMEATFILVLKLISIECKTEPKDLSTTINSSYSDGIKNIIELLMVNIFHNVGKKIKIK